MPFSERIAIIKAKMDNDVFTTQPEAAARSMDMGFGGATHVTQDEMGQAFYMPGESHEDYINYYSTSEIEEPEGEDDSPSDDSPSDDSPSDDSPSDDSPSDDSMEEGAMEAALRIVIQEILSIEKAEGKPLNKPFRLPAGSSKKFGVYVKDGDKTKKVTFGDPNMEIRRDDPKARANFRSRHSCDTATDKTSARYWSCRMWEEGTSVSDMTKFDEEPTKMSCDLEGKILKADDEERMVYGWASVITENGIPVIDRQGDVIEAEVLVKAVNNFMEHVRVGKAMHTGEQVGVVVHSFPVTKELGDALGIQSDREGWIVAYKVYDDAVWAMVKSGELAAFSIGGRATKEDI